MADCNNCGLYLSPEDLIARSIKCSADGKVSALGGLLNVLPVTKINYNEVTTPLGTPYLENQISANVEKITVQADREFSSDTAFWTKKAGTTIGSGVATITGLGALNASSGNWALSRTLLAYRKWFKLTFSVRIISGAGNFQAGSGFLKQFDAAVTSEFTTHTVYLTPNLTGTEANNIKLNFGGALNAVYELDNVSCEEVGWSDSVNLYNYIYQYGSGTLYPATELSALKAAAMWRHPNNNAELSAIYGRLYNKFAAKLLALDTVTYNEANPTTAQTHNITTTVQNAYIASTYNGNELKQSGTAHWNTANGTNKSKLEFLGAGYINSEGVYSGLKDTCYLLSQDGDARIIQDANDTFNEVAITTEGGSIRLYEIQELKILVIGSSHNMDIITGFPILANKAGVKIKAANLYKGGIQLDAILSMFINNEDFDYYSTNATGLQWVRVNTGVGTRTGLKALTDDNWDIITIGRDAANCHTWSVEQKTALLGILDYISETCNNTPTVMFNSGFSYPIDTPTEFTRQNQIDRTALINSTAQLVATDTGLEVIPMATAIQNARSTILNTYGTDADKDIARDAIHLDTGIGCYVSGCLMFEKIIKSRFKYSIANLNYLPVLDDVDGVIATVSNFTAITEDMANVAKLCAISAIATPYEIDEQLAINYPPI